MGCWEQPLSSEQVVRIMRVFTSVKLDSIVRSVNGTSLRHFSRMRWNDDKKNKPQKTKPSSLLARSGVQKD